MYFLRFYYSGGIERNWVGVPRKLNVPGSQSYRCACVNIMHQDVYKKDSLYSKYFTEYENCDSDSRSCYIGI